MRDARSTYIDGETYISPPSDVNVSGNISCLEPDLISMGGTLISSTNGLKIRHSTGTVRRNQWERSYLCIPMSGTLSLGHHYNGIVCGFYKREAQSRGLIFCQKTFSTTGSTLDCNKTYWELCDV